MTEFVSSDVDSRSEVVLLYDVKRANPNGNPLSSNDKPRIDDRTQQAIVTPSRLKRFLRDQMTDDGRGVYLVNPDKTDTVSKDRTQLFTEAVGMSPDEIGEADAEEVYSAFLNHALDVRMFGAPLSVDSDLMADEDNLSFTGPIQFGLGESLHEVVPNDESKKLSPTVASSEDATQGTFAEDNRLQYALIGFTGIINEVNAQKTGLSSEDIEYLDSAVWRALKNQSLSHSKQGHNPQLYVRAEYDGGYHAGEMRHTLSLDPTESAADPDLRNIRDAVVDVSEFVSLLQDEEVQDHLQQLHVNAGRYLQVSHNGETGGRDFLYETLRDVADVTVIDPYNQ